MSNLNYQGSFQVYKILIESITSVYPPGPGSKFLQGKSHVLAKFLSVESSTVPDTYQIIKVISSNSY